MDNFELFWALTVLFIFAINETNDMGDKLCLPHHILEEKGLIKVGITVQALLDETSANETLIT